MPTPCDPAQECTASGAVPPGLPGKQEFPRTGFAADEGEAQEVEGLRLAEPSRFATFCCKASELDEPGLLGMKLQRKFLQPRAQLIEEAPHFTVRHNRIARLGARLPLTPAKGYFGPKT
jgi:hypothetical protein